MNEIKTIDDLIESLQEILVKVGTSYGDWDEGFYDGINAALRNAKELKSHLDKYKWHKVEEELPKFEEDVLLYCEGMAYVMEGYIDFHGHWYITHLEYSLPESADCINRVTHWRYVDKLEE